MLNDQVFYHETIRNTIVSFGKLFSNIKIARKNNGNVQEQLIQVPIAYSQKEKWVHSIEANPDNERGVYAALPRLGFEITGYSYDSSRKIAKMNKIHCTSDDGQRHVFTPVPYNLDLSLYFATKTQEDGLQILEQILPTFSPEYTMSINSIPDLNIVQDVPFILNGVSVQDDYEGDLSTRRFVIHTLNFTAKINLFGGVSNVGVIKQVEADVSTRVINDPERSYIASQPTISSPITEEWLDNF
jgi:hypothetical protein